MTARNLSVINANTASAMFQLIVSPNLHSSMTADSRCPLIALT